MATFSDTKNSRILRHGVKNINLERYFHVQLKVNNISSRFCLSVCCVFVSTVTFYYIQVLPCICNSLNFKSIGSSSRFKKSYLSECNLDTTLINMHETHMVSAEGHGHPLQGARPR